MRLRRFTIAFTALVLGGFASAFSASLALEEVIKEVCVNSDSARMMKESYIKSDRMVTEKWSAALPTLSGSINASRMYQQGAGARKDQSGSTFHFGAMDSSVKWRELAPLFGSLSTLTAPMEIPYYTTSLTLSQPLYTFGKIGTAVEIARQFDNSVHCTNSRNIQQLQLTALDAFYQVVLSEKVLAVSQRSLARKKELSEFLNRNFSLGSGNKAYLLASQADLNSQYSEAISAQQNARTAKLRLCAFMGRELTDSLTLDTVLAMPSNLSAPPPEVPEAIKTAEEHREDLKAIGFMTEANKGGAKIYNAMYLPSIGLQASLGTGGSEVKDMIDWDKRRNWVVGVGMQWTFFDGFANRAKSQQYQSDARKLEIAHQAIRKMIEIEVRSARSECAAADSNLQASRAMVAAANEGYDLTSENFKTGSGQFSDLQLAEERLRQAELGRVSAHYRWIRSRAALRVATGLDIIKVEEK